MTRLLAVGASCALGILAAIGAAPFPGLAADGYAKSGVPVADLDVPILYNTERNSLCLGVRVVGDEWRILGQAVQVELWVRNVGAKDVKFENVAPGRNDLGLRVLMTGEDGKERAAAMPVLFLEHPMEKMLLPPAHAVKVREFSIVLSPPEGAAPGGSQPHFQLPPGAYNLVCTHEVMWTASRGADGQPLKPPEDVWTGTLTSRGLHVMIIAPDAPPPKPRVEHAEVDISKDGEISLNRKRMTLDELKARAAANAKKWFTIRADEDVPFAKVVELVEALKAAGVVEFSFSEARMGDGKYRVANRQGAYEFDGKHKFSMCRPGEHPQWFTVSWPAGGDWPRCWLRTFPHVSEQTRGKWAVVWEPGTDVLWWVDDSNVGKMTLTDPAHVIVDREGRKNNFSRDFGLPEGVVAEFRRLGFEIGRDRTPGREIAIGGNTGGQSIVSAEFGTWSIVGTVTDAEGKPMEDVPVRVTLNQELQTEKTDQKGKYRAYFNLSLERLAHWRGVTVEPVLEGFTERAMAKAGEFNVLLQRDEQPQRVRLAGDKDFRPGPIPRFAERDLVPSPPGVTPGTPGHADFVMLQAGQIAGEIVTADGQPAPPHWVAAITQEQRPGKNAAIVLSDAKGHFRLKGIPTHRPVLFTVNPDTKPGEISKSAEEKFERADTHRIRLVLPPGGSGNGALKVERVAE